MRVAELSLCPGLHLLWPNISYQPYFQLQADALYTVAYDVHFILRKVDTCSQHQCFTLCTLCLCCWPSYYSLVSYSEKYAGSVNPISVGKWMLHSCLASFLAEAVMTAGGKFISSWLWHSQPPEKHKVGTLDSRMCFRAIS